MNKTFATLRKFLIGGIALATLPFSNLAHAAPVGLELLLLVDVSGSVDAAEYGIQKTGYINAFNDASIQGSIAGVTGGVAVGYAEWSGSGSQVMLVNWTLLTDAASSSAFATAIGGSVRAFNGSTAPGSAINWGVSSFAANGFEGARKVIDVSGDGEQNSGDNTLAASTAAAAAGFTLNGLPIGDAALATWYQTNIVTPGGGFLQAASGFDDFESAVKSKIGKEIIGSVPEPGALTLMGLGLLGFALQRKRRVLRG